MGLDSFAIWFMLRSLNEENDNLKHTIVINDPYDAPPQHLEVVFEDKELASNIHHEQLNTIKLPTHLHDIN